MIYDLDLNLDLNLDYIKEINMDKKKLVSDEQILREAGVRVTAVRLLVWRTIHREFSGIFNLAELEEKLPTVDKSTLFRTLNLLSENHLLDMIEFPTLYMHLVCAEASDNVYLFGFFVLPNIFAIYHALQFLSQKYAKRVRFHHKLLAE